MSGTYLLQIGHSGLRVTGYLNGYLDEFRISKGIARWITGFTPQTAPYDSDGNTKLLLHGESLDVAGNNSLAFAGTAQLSTAQKKFGTAGLLLNGSNDYLSMPDSDDWNFGTGDFAVDTFLKFNALPSSGNTKAIWAQRMDGNNYARFTVYNNGGTYQWKFELYPNSNILNYAANSPGLNTTDWYHLALTRSGNNTRIFQNGIQCGTTDTTSYTYPDINGAFFIGYDNWNSSWYLSGWLDEFRITKGTARWTANFTPPAIEYSTTTATYNMTLVSTTTLAVSMPSSARIVLFEEDVDTVTPNSDLNAYVTGRDTTSWTQVTLADEGYYNSGRRILAGMAGVTAASTGTAMRWKVETHNNRNLKLHGVGLNWD